MTVLSTYDAVNIAYSANFRGHPLAVIVSIAIAESGLDTNALNCYNMTIAPGHVVQACDRGILQFNSWWHPEIADSCAFDAYCAFRAAWTVSNHGTSFASWATYTSGAYLKYIQGVQAVINSTFGSTQQQLGSIASAGAASGSMASTTGVSYPVPTTPSSYGNYSGTPWYDFGITWGHTTNVGQGGEHGVDIGTALNTPITAVFSGVITDISGFPPPSPTSSGYASKPWGGQVTWQLDNPMPAHGAPYEYVLHLNAINPNLKVGSHINAGDLLGWSGGEIPGQTISHAPTGQYTIDSPSASGGAHTEIGLAYGPVFGSGAGYQNIDPTFMLALAQAEHLPYGTGGAGPFPGSLNGVPGLSLQNDVASMQALYGSFAGQPIQRSAFTYNQLSFNVHNTLVQNQGFYGICLALDTAEQFPGFYNPGFGPQDNPLEPWNLARDVGESVVGTIVNNTLPIVIRGGLMIVGYILLLMLLWQLMKPFIGEAAELLPLAMLAGA